ncbi:hypothetical protein QJQ45_000667 [Haematococcus lacustris]|nr:hypothetical protein QJQ45_000667 [Haematococcus lacustris]
MTCWGPAATERGASFTPSAQLLQAAGLMALVYAPSRTVVYAPAEECDKEADLKSCCAPGLAVYAPSRTVVVYASAEECDKDADLKSWGVPGLAVKGLGPGEGWMGWWVGCGQAVLIALPAGAAVRGGLLVGVVVQLRLVVMLLMGIFVPDGGPTQPLFNDCQLHHQLHLLPDEVLVASGQGLPGLSYGQLAGRRKLIDRF